MIIECKECGTKYRFDETRVGEEGVWVRCTRCGHVFHERKTTEEGAVGLDRIVTSTAVEESGRAEEELPAAGAGEEAPPEEKKSPDERPAPPPEEMTLPRAKRRQAWTPIRIGLYLAMLVIVLGGVYLYLFPQIGEQVLNLFYSKGPEKAVTVEKKPAPPAPAAGINFSEVRERFLKNLIVGGDILVIQGTAVNDFDYSVSKIRVRGKILDNAGKLLGETEVFAGNILTDEELVKFTDKEILDDLSKPEGSDVSNVSIAPKGKIPFMVTFINPPKEVDEFIIELVGFERTTGG
ncbi:MAG TPA: DUF3426 domain-containing protein [Syntrophales bacterium]|jgi:predicted Zn finger-like uncharacterized protein|nr:DUF3426 domain-containing protein [Syntrophales bacterium]HRT61607.1 DUF3426 domain-containing protein [Syntrophales bacterium]